MGNQLYFLTGKTFDYAQGRRHKPRIHFSKILRHLSALSELLKLREIPSSIKQQSLHHQNDFFSITLERSYNFYDYPPQAPTSNSCWVLLDHCVLNKPCFHMFRSAFVKSCLSSLVRFSNKPWCNLTNWINVTKWIARISSHSSSTSSFFRHLP